MHQICPSVQMSVPPAPVCSGGSERLRSVRLLVAEPSGSLRASAILRLCASDPRAPRAPLCFGVPVPLRQVICCSSAFPYR